MRRAGGFERAVGGRARVARGRAGGGHGHRLGADLLHPGVEIGGVEQARDGHGHERRIADEAVAVGIHQPARLGEQEPGLRIGRPAAGDVGPLEKAEQLEQADPACRRRRAAHQIDAERAAQRRPLDRAVGGEVSKRHRSAERTVVGPGDDLRRRAARVQRGRSLVGQAAEEGGIGRIAKRSAGLEQRPVGCAEIGQHVRRAIFREIAGDHPAQTRTDGEALVGGALGRSEQRAPRQDAVRPLHRGEHRHRSGDAGRPARQHRIAERQRLSRGIEEQGGGGLRRGDFASVVDGDLAGRAVEPCHEGAAADAGALRFDQRQHRLHRDRRIGGAAAAAKHLHPRAGGKRVGGDHEGRLADGLRRGGRRRNGRARAK